MDHPARGYLAVAHTDHPARVFTTRAWRSLRGNVTPLFCLALLIRPFLPLALAGALATAAAAQAPVVPRLEASFSAGVGYYLQHDYDESRLLPFGLIIFQDKNPFATSTRLRAAYTLRGHRTRFGLAYSRWESTETVDLVYNPQATNRAVIDFNEFAMSDVANHYSLLWQQRLWHRGKLTLVSDFELGMVLVKRDEVTNTPRGEVVVKTRGFANDNLAGVGTVYGATALYQANRHYSLSLSGRAFHEGGVGDFTYLGVEAGVSFHLWAYE